MELVHDVKHNLRCYNFFKKQIEEWKDEILVLENKIISTSGSFVKIPDGTNEMDIHKNSDIWEKIYIHQNDIKYNKHILRKVELFLNKLEFRDRKIFEELYINKMRRSESEVAIRYGFSRRGLQHRTSMLIEKYWE